MNIIKNNLLTPIPPLQKQEEKGLYANHSTSFKANIKSPKLLFKQEDFFVRIYGYGKNRNWAYFAKETADLATFMMRDNKPIEKILQIISYGIRNANSYDYNIDKKLHTGILRDYRKDWISGYSPWQYQDIYTSYSNLTRYKPYKKRLDERIKKPLKNPYNNIGLTIPTIIKKIHLLRHPNYRYTNNALDKVFELYENFNSNFNSETIKKKDLPKVNNLIAEIRWILAHSTPWERGSDAISNVFTRAMYKSIGIKSHPLAKGISLDLEAYCTNLKDYKKNFSKYFEKPPEVIE